MVGTGQELAGCAVVFKPADPPRESRVAFWDPEGGPLPLGVGEQTELDLIVDAAPRTVRAIELPVADAVPLLGRARQAPSSHPSAAFWGAAALAALQLVARGKLLPGLSPAGHDAWRVGPLDADDVTRVLTLAEAMPPTARALPLPTPQDSTTGSPRPRTHAPARSRLTLRPRPALARDRVLGCGCLWRRSCCGSFLMRWRMGCLGRRRLRRRTRSGCSRGLRRSGLSGCGRGLMRCRWGSTPGCGSRCGSRWPSRWLSALWCSCTA